MGNIKEAELIAPMFGGNIKPEDIVSLPPFTGYMKTLQTGEIKDSTMMSFETMDYKSEFTELHTEEELEELSNKCLDQFGEETGKIMTEYHKKMDDVFDWYLG
jgi:hypothetical protein